MSDNQRDENHPGLPFSIGPEHQQHKQDEPGQDLRNADKNSPVVNNWLSFCVSQHTDIVGGDDLEFSKSRKRNSP